MSVRSSSASSPACTGARRRAEPLCAEAFPSSPPPSAISDLHRDTPSKSADAVPELAAGARNPPRGRVACGLRNAWSGGNPSRARCRCCCCWAGEVSASALLH
ncbi:hypothetical protein PR202_ga02660 [Eleusine coracana subsp. coracana]|uniref:Uncharacterized protein n=1 Tax=Eleusine coracana subsp. coracana TaxID=191504 RepID=A0AAV5BM52_ELECO|nr:hypothetical protein PR202_ga02660 [Eleusine coracana subsp. coracana]